MYSGGYSSGSGGGAGGGNAKSMPSVLGYSYVSEDGDQDDSGVFYDGYDNDSFDRQPQGTIDEEMEAALRLYASPITPDLSSNLAHAGKKMSMLFSPGRSRQNGVGGGAGELQAGSLRRPLKQHDPHGGDPGAQSTALQGTLNAVNLLLGMGVLSLPFALKSSGWIIGMSLLVFLTILTNYTGKLLGRCLSSDPAIRTFPDIGYAAYGKSGRAIVSITFFMELLAACGMYLILCVDNLDHLFPNTPRVDLVLIFTGIVLPTTWTRNLSFLSYFSIIGVVASWFLLIVLIYHGASTGKLTSPQPTQMYTSFEEWPISIGLVMVGFAGHAAFPSVYRSLKSKSSFGTVLNASYIIVAIANVLIAVCGYLMYGRDTNQEITINMLQDIKDGVGSPWLVKAATWVIVINPLTKFALTLNPVAINVESWLERHCTRSDDTVRMTPHAYAEIDDGESGVGGRSSTSSASCCGAVKKALFRIVVRSVLTGLAVGLAVGVPHFARVVSFVGAIFSFSVSAIFPPLCYMVICRDRLSTCERVLNVSIVVVCFALAAGGTYGSMFSAA